MDDMVELSRSAGDGFVEFRKGLEFKKAGDDKTALLYFYTSIMTRFDNPGLYEETARILHRHELYEEELNVFQKGLDVIKKGSFYYSKIESEAVAVYNKLLMLEQSEQEQY